MSLRNNINNDLNIALKEGRRLEVEVLRGLNAVLHNKEIEKRSAFAKASADKEQEELEKVSELTDEEVVEVLGREVKKRKEAAELYKQGNRPELAEKEEKEMVIIQKYLPEQMSKEEIEKVVDEVLQQFTTPGVVNFGEAMKAVMAELKGKADGRVVAEIIKRVLAR